MPYDRPTWDLTSLLYVVEPNEGYFQTSEKGIITVDSLGATSFKPQTDGSHIYLKVDDTQAEVVKDRFVELIKVKPLSIK